MSSLLVTKNLESSPHTDHVQMEKCGEVLEVLIASCLKMAASYKRICSNRHQ